ncbi:MAG: cyclic nucleotide-binding domain-containing protein [Verrucomicrobiota bacterium]
MSQEFNRPTLPECGFLAGVRDDDRDLLASYGEFLGIQPDHDMIRQGEQQHHVYFVISGKLEVRRQGLGDDIVVGTIEKGESIGEISVFDHGEASASIRALEFTQVWRIDGDSLKEFIQESPACGNTILLGLSVILSKRVRLLSRQLVDARTSS